MIISSGKDIKINKKQTIYHKTLHIKERKRLTGEGAERGVPCKAERQEYQMLLT
jgi:hypothetical protein